MLEADIQSFYDALDHSQLRSFLDQRVRDGVIRRALDKWLKAGVMEGGTLSHPTTGTPQGGVISPLLSNLYLHEVLDTWFEAVVKPRLQGVAFLIRFADDFVLVFQLESDARRMLEVLPKRFGKYGLSLHPDKTRLVRFERPGPTDGSGRTQPHEKPRSFDFLGFTHFWARSRRGRWMVKRKTASDRITRFLRRINEWCRGNRHAPLDWQHAHLLSKLRGHSGYYGITGNSLSLSSVHQSGQADLAQVAQSPLAKAQHALEAVSASLEAVPATEPESLCWRPQSRVANPGDLKNRMREFRTYGSVGGLGGQPPRPTRRRPRGLRSVLVTTCHVSTAFAAG